MNAIIIEDQADSRKTLRSLLEKKCPQVTILAEAENVEDGISIIQQYQPELVFLDVHLQNATGFDLLNRLDEIYFKIIFTTAYDNYAIKAFRFSAIDYILKPIDPAELVSAVNKCEQTVFNQINQQASVRALSENVSTDYLSSKKIILSTADKIHVLKVTDIVRCEAADTYTLFHLQNGEQIVVTKTLKEYEELLSEFNFLRIHKSHLVNMQYVSSFEKSDGTSLNLSNGSKVPVATRKKDGLMQWLQKI